MERLELDGAAIAYHVQGHGEPILLIAPALFADGLGRPLLAQLPLDARYQLIHYHRRGYGESTLGPASLTMTRQARDAVALLRHLGLRAAHIAGYSYGGLIALQLVVDAPDLVHSLALLEPALRRVPSGPAYDQNGVLPMLHAYQVGDKRAAMEISCNVLLGPHWQPVVERALPGGTEQALRDVDTFIQEQPAIRDWDLDRQAVAGIQPPLLSVLGAQFSAFPGRTGVAARLVCAARGVRRSDDASAAHARPARRGRVPGRLLRAASHHRASMSKLGPAKAPGTAGADRRMRWPILNAF